MRNSQVGVTGSSGKNRRFNLICGFFVICYKLNVDKFLVNPYNLYMLNDMPSGRQVGAR